MKPGATAGRRTATLIVNRHARRAGTLDAPAAADRIRRAGFDVRIAYPKGPAANSAVAREAAARGDDLIFVAGGDGTVRDAALGLIGSGSTLAPLPCGTVNVLARELGIPPGITDALDAHLDGRRQAMDVGWADHLPFLLMASAGWDAGVARDVDLRIKRRLGDGAYVIGALAALPGLRTATASWRVGEAIEHRPLAMMVISNTRLYGGRVRFTPDALANDGLLDVVAMCPASASDALRIALHAARGHVAAAPGVTSMRCAAIAIETPGIPVQLDGDYVGETPMTFRVQPSAICVSMPAGAAPAVLQSPAV